MDKIKKGLGRGLSSLIGETKVEAKTNQLPVSDLIPNKYQPRKNFDEKHLEDLTNSIKERGMIQPIIVRKSYNENSKFEIIAGERRWLAAQRAGIHNVPVVITEADDLKSLEFAIVENVQRHDLNPLEEAQGYKRLIDEFSYDQEKVSKFIGKSRSYITNSLRILTLPNEVIKLIEEFSYHIEKMEWQNANYKELTKNLISLSGDEPSDIIDKLNENYQQQVSIILNDPHAKISPALRKTKKQEIAHKTLKEEFMKLETSAGMQKEIRDAIDDLHSSSSESLTWRLNQATKARTNAEKSTLDDIETAGEDKTAMTDFLQNLIDNEVWVKKNK